VTLIISLGRDSIMTVAADGSVIATRRWVAPAGGRAHLFVTGHSVESPVRLRALRIWSRGQP
jgi:hypothetical protein